MVSVKTKKVVNVLTISGSIIKNQRRIEKLDFFLHRLVLFLILCCLFMLTHLYFRQRLAFLGSNLFCFLLKTKSSLRGFRNDLRCNFGHCVAAYGFMASLASLSWDEPRLFLNYFMPLRLKSLSSDCADNFALSLLIYTLLLNDVSLSTLWARRLAILPSEL